MSKSNPMHHKSRWTKHDCYYCGDIVYIDQNNDDKKGNQAYFGEDSSGHLIITCPQHYRG